MNEISELNEINEQDEQREDLKKEADREKEYHVVGEIHDAYHKWRENNHSLADNPEYLILDRDSYHELLLFANEASIVDFFGLTTYKGMKIAILQTTDAQHHVQVC